MLNLAINGKNFSLPFFILFLLMTVLTKEILKVQGFMLDCGKVGTKFSAYFAAEVIADLFYFFFYRAMFDHVHDWYTFAVLQASHLLCEWLIHPARASVWYYSRVRSLCDKASPRVREVLLIMLLTAQPNVVYNDWVCFVALETSIR